MNSNLPRALLLALFANTVIALLGCDGDVPLPPSTDSAQGGAVIPEFTSVKLQLNWVAEPEFGGFYAAQEKALYQAEGLQVELIQGGPSVPAPQLVASGKVEFAIVAGSQLLELREQGGDLVALYAVYQGNPMGVMVHEASPYQTLRELWESDATVAFEQGLADFRWITKSFPGGHLKLVPYSANLAQFASDPTMAAQCFITSEPVTLALQGVKTRVFLVGESGFDPYNQVLVTTRAYYDSHTDLCQKMVRATAAGWRAYLDTPEPFNAVMTRLNAGMSLDAMNRGAALQRVLVENDETKRIGLGGMRAVRWQTTIDQLNELGAIKTRPDPTTLFVWDNEAPTAR